MSAQWGVPNREGVLGVWMATGAYTRVMASLREARDYLDVVAPACDGRIAQAALDAANDAIDVLEGRPPLARHAEGDE